MEILSSNPKAINVSEFAANSPNIKRAPDITEKEEEEEIVEVNNETDESENNNETSNLIQLAIRKLSAADTFLPLEDFEFDETKVASPNIRLGTLLPSKSAEDLVGLEKKKNPIVE